MRPLRNGDVDTVKAAFERLGDRSRQTRFLGAKRRLTDSDLARLTAIGANHHALVAYVHGDARPVAIARLIRAGDSAGITEITALVASDNPAAVALLRRAMNALEIRSVGPELEISAALR